MIAKMRRITSVDVAREAGVSQSTVSFVLNNDLRQSIPEETRAKVIEAARKLDYQPSAAARMLRTGQSKIVLVVYEQSAIESGVSRILEDLAEAVGNLGFSLVMQIGFSPEREHLTGNLAPAVVVWLGDPNNSEAMAGLQRFKAPIVSLANRAWVNNGPRLQVEYLLKKGARQIVFAATEKPQLQTMCRGRQEIVRQVCAEHGLPDPRVVTIFHTREKTRQAIADLLAVQSTPFGICAFNDDTAIAILAALFDLKIAVPDVVSVIGHDNTMVGELSNPPLTTISLVEPEMIEQLIASVISVCQGGPVLESITPDEKVIVRASA
jgi:DNA-binding LacI/PurR family transcriptional regulator